MVTVDTCRSFLLSLPETSEEPHFEKTSFRVKKKIIATCNAENQTTCVKLSAADQYVFSAAGKASVYPVPNKWGAQGWTMIDMKNVEEDLFTDALRAAYCQVAPPKLAEEVRRKRNSESAI